VPTAQWWGQETKKVAICATAARENTARCEVMLLKGNKKQRTDFTYVFAAVRSLLLLKLVGEIIRRNLNEMVRVAPY
jgi:hypothetical protein